MPYPQRNLFYAPLTYRPHRNRNRNRPLLSPPSHSKAPDSDQVFPIFLISSDYYCSRSRRPLPRRENNPESGLTFPVCNEQVGKNIVVRGEFKDDWGEEKGGSVERVPKVGLEYTKNMEFLGCLENGRDGEESASARVRQCLAREVGKFSWHTRGESP